MGKRSETFVLVVGDERVPLSPGEWVVGSSPSCDVVINDPTVSRRHAVLNVSKKGDVVVEDLGSTNGTKVGGKRITREVLEPGMLIRFGRVVCTLELVDSSDVELGVELGSVAAQDGKGEARREGETLRAWVMEQLIADVLPRLVEVARGTGSAAEAARFLAAAIFNSLPVTSVLLRLPSSSTDSAGTDAVMFEARREDTGPNFDVVLEAGPYILEIRSKISLGPRALRVLASLCRLVPEPMPTTPRKASRHDLPPPLPDPPTVDPVMLEIYKAAASVAKSRLPVLILGESGTGKEVLARYIHAASPWADGPFHALNCAALPADLLEAELFGIERGVATGVEARPGWFERADGGTLLLDEIADMSLRTQAKILRVLQSGEVHRLGSRKFRKVNVRLIAATNQDLQKAIKQGRFRADLYYRLAGWEVTIPPLRKRRADIPNLAAFFLMRAAESRGITVRGISRAAVEAMVEYHWPGNVRELEREMERAALFLTDGAVLDTSRLNPRITSALESSKEGGLASEISRLQRDEIIRAIVQTRSVEEAARVLGMSRATLYRRMKALGIDPKEVAFPEGSSRK